MTICITPHGKKYRPVIHLRFADPAGQSPAIWRGKLYDSPAAAEGVAKIQMKRLWDLEQETKGTLAALALHIRLDSEDETELRERIEAAAAYNAQLREKVIAKRKHRNAILAGQQRARERQAEEQRKRRLLEAQVAAAEHARQLAQADPSAEFEHGAGGLVIARRVTPGSYAERMERNPF